MFIKNPPKALDNDHENLQNFVNSWLAEPWEDTQTKTSARLLMRRRTELSSGIVPSWAKLLTGGIDVQKDGLYRTVRAWGDFMTSQNLAHGKVSRFAEVERIMDRSWIRQNSGVPMIVSLALIDSGNDTEIVYDFCASHAEWALPYKGSSVSMAANFRVSRVNLATSHAHGMRLVIVDTEKYKDAIAGRMMRKNCDGSWMIPQDCDIEYADQIIAEHKINVRKNGKIRQMWVPKTSHRPNHYLDCEVYAMCAADMLDIRMIHLENLEESVPDLEPRNVSESVGSEESWLSISDNWLS